LCVIYLILFPYLDKETPKGNKQYSILSAAEIQNELPGLYYYEFEEMYSLDNMLSKTVDSIFVSNYLVSHKNSVTLKDPLKTKVHFTNNYSSSTLRCYSHYKKTKDEDYLHLFKKNAIWMLANAKVINDSVLLFCNDNMIYDKYNLDYGWSSAYAQGYGLSVFVRMYQETQDPIWLEAGEKVLNSFNLKKEQGGILEIDEENNFWYLEYPAEPSAKVLNGFIFGLLGIYDYYRITKSTKASNYFHRGIDTIISNLPKYDLGYWSKYDLLYDFAASYGYHKSVHIPQLISMHNITNNQVFLDYAEKFDKYLNEPYYTIFKIKFTFDSLRRRVTYKNPFKKYKKARFSENKK
jgi:hypothetical protein